MSETCAATITFVLDPDVGKETLNCDLDAGHNGQHRDGTTTWGKAKITNQEGTQMTETTATEATTDTVTEVRRTLMQAATHWSDVSETHRPNSTTDQHAAETHAAAAMATIYPYALAALLGQMAETEREGDEKWTAEEAASFVEDLFENGDADNLNADVKPELATT